MGYIIDIEKLEKFITVKKTGKNANSDIETEIRETFSFNEEGIKERLISRDVVTREFPKGKEIDSVRYDIILNLLSIIFQGNEELDTTLGLERALQSSGLALDLAFTTLVEYGIIKEL
jgi:hypothetical protein